jgi:hypothetical protein
MRARMARERLLRLRAMGGPAGRPEWPSALDAWLQVATAAEVRRAWRSGWGPLPGFAR